MSFDSGEHTSCYVAYKFCTLVNALHVTLHMSFACLLFFGECYFAHVFCSSVSTIHVTLHTSFVLRWTFVMIMTYVKAWQWRYIHRNADVCDITARTVRKLAWREKKCWPCGETQNHPKNVTFFGGVLHACLNSHCNNSKIFHKSQWTWSTKRNHHECKHVANAKISTRQKTEWS